MSARRAAWVAPLVAALLAACAGSSVEPSGAGGEGGARADAAADDAGGACHGVPSTGICVDATHLASCRTTGDVEALATTICAAGTSCVVSPGGAACAADRVCAPGETACATGWALRSCDASGAWLDALCPSGQVCAPGASAAACVPAPVGPRLTGTLRYERRARRADLSGWGDLVVEPAPGLALSVYEGATLLATGTTAPDGAWGVTLSRAAQAPLVVYFAAQRFAGGAHPVAAVAQAASSAASVQRATAYWTWGQGPLDPATTDAGTQVIAEAAGSGAVHLFAWLGAALDADRARFSAPAPSVLVLWSPEVTFDCGSCFSGASLGGGRVDTAAGSDAFDTTIAISGGADALQHWSSSVVAHELGHWAMAARSRPPGESGRHSLTGTSTPAIAYAEGWATFAGQALVTRAASGAYDPLYFDVKAGTAYWADLAQRTASGGAVPLADPAGPLDQPMNEVVVASTLWCAWGDATQGGACQGLGDGALFGALASRRLLDDPTYDRGYAQVDLVDFLDALACTGGATDAQIAAVTAPVGFPYASTGRSCPP